MAPITGDSGSSSDPAVVAGSGVEEAPGGWLVDVQGK